MLFLTRSALCIGLVAVAASRMGPGEVSGAVDRGMREAGEAAASACLRSAGCVGLGTSVLARTAGLPSTAPDRAVADPPLRPPPARRPRRPIGSPGQRAAAAPE